MTSRITQVINTILFTLAICVQAACQASVAVDPGPVQSGSAPVEIPTWTALPQEEPFQVNPAPTIRTIAASPPASTPRPAEVTISAINGNMNIRRGPGVDYNTTGLLEEGETAFAVGRDRIRRWLFIEYPTVSGKTGWVSVLTAYTEIEGEIDALPVISVDPATPAFIRNCTKHTLWVLPARVELLPKANEPYNEERFSPGLYQVFDLDVSSDETIDEINLREGLFVDVIRDGNDVKSKCE
jgi:hypothetical protein